MAKSDMIEVEGVVVEALPNTTFQVDIGNGHTILATFPETQNEFYQNSAW